MKKILFILSLFISTDSFAQVTVLAKISDIATSANATSAVIIVNDSLRGGVFGLYSGKNPVDNGMILKDFIGRKWLRQNVSAINIDWFGAKRDGVTDNRVAILAAIASAKANLTNVKIFIPAGDLSGSQQYFISDSINIDVQIELYGEGYLSVLKFAAHKRGLKFTYPHSQYSNVHDIKIACTQSASFLDSSKHGIICKTPVVFTNVTVEGFDGCGFYLNNAYAVGNIGNSNNAVFNHCFSNFNRLHGFYFRGGDANNMTLINCDASINGGAGFYDKSFLGNKYYSCHTATNGSPELSWQRGLVSWGGKVYACIKDTTAGHPPPNATYWQDIGTGWLAYPHILPYNTKTVYYAVGGYILEGANQYGNMVGCYSEGDQAPGFSDIGNVIVGGGMGYRNVPVNLYGSLGALHSRSHFVGDDGVSSDWLYGGKGAIYFNGASLYKDKTGLIAGSYDKAGMVDFWDNNKRIGSQYTTPAALNILTQAGKNISIYTNGNTTTPKIFVDANTVGIGTATPAASAQLEIASTTQGFLPPRMTATQARAIKSPAEGLIVYVTDTNTIFTSKGWWGFNGSSWEKLNN